MKSKLLNAARLLSLCIVTALTLLFGSCDGAETTDSTGFILHYYGVTDIGPSMSYTLPAPTYKGSAPSEFTITNVTLNDEAYTNSDNFVIDAETGAITIQNTETMSAGLYHVSVGCYSNGSFHNFKNAVQINMLLAVPEGVTVEPAEVLVNQDEENWAEATAQVTTDKDKHVSIAGYAIAEDVTKPYLKYFAINNEGKITIKSGTTEQQLIAGENYILSLKLTTKAGEHMYADAVTFKVIAKPRNLFYIEQEALPDLFEAEHEGKSATPTIGGSKEGLKFAIKSVAPKTSAFTINETTGQISLPEGHTLPISEDPYIFTITVSNTYGSVDFEAIYSAKIVAYIEPIQPETFHYTAVNKLYQLGGSFEDQLPDAGLIGGAITFQLDENNSDEIKTQIAQNIISINTGNGAISIANNHTLSAKTHEIKVRVTNKKNEEGVVTSLSVTVVENPNNFTYVSWGTNVENEITINPGTNKTIPIDTDCKEETKEEYRNLFRFIQGRDVVDIPLKKIKMINENSAPTFTYKILKDNFVGHEKIISGAAIKADGTIYFTNLNSKKNFADGSNNSDGCIFQISVTAKGNNAPDVTRNIPIFISTPKPAKLTYPDFFDGKEANYTLLCTPFVVRVNPKTGKCDSFTMELHNIGAKEDVDGVQTNFSLGGTTAVLDKFVLDYRDQFSYCNFSNNIEHATGEPTLEGSLLNQVWTNCGIVTKTTNTPFRYYDHETGNQDIQNIKAAYIDAATRQLAINPNVWRTADGKYPHGAVVGRVSFNLQEATKFDTKTAQQYSLIIWFDETYEGN